MTLLRRCSTLALVIGLTATLALDEAWAGKKDKDKGKDEPPTIELTGIAAFDDVFTRVQAIDERLAAAEGLLKTAKKDLIDALALEKGTPLKDAIADLQEKADGKIAVVMKGKQPKLEPTDAVPENVQSAIDAVNRLTDGITASIEELKAIPAEVEGIVQASESFPDKLQDELKADPTASLTQAPKILSTLKGNATVTAGLPERSETVVTRMTDMIEVVTSTFAPGGVSQDEGATEDGTSGGGAAPVAGTESAGAEAAVAPGQPDPAVGNVAEKLSGKGPSEVRERRGGRQEAPADTETETDTE